MLQTRVIPCLLLNDGRLVKTIKFTNPRYVGDPINAIKIYNEKEVDELIVVDISATKEHKEPNYQLISEMASECFMPLCYGGGINNIEQIKKIFNLGIEKVAINSHAAERPEFIKEASSIFGSQSIVASVDIKKNWLGKYSVKTLSGTKSVENDPIRYVKKMANLGAGEILLNSIDRDGTWLGYDHQLIRSISDAVDIPVIALGGAGTLQHISEAVSLGGASAAAIGSMAVFQGKDLGVLIRFPTKTDLQTIFPSRF